jgi:hypothetical protein
VKNPMRNNMNILMDLKRESLFIINKSFLESLLKIDNLSYNNGFAI